MLCFEKDIMMSWMSPSVSCVIFESVPSVTVSSPTGRAREHPIPRSCHSCMDWSQEVLVFIPFLVFVTGGLAQFRTVMSLCGWSDGCDCWWKSGF